MKTGRKLVLFNRFHTAAIIIAMVSLLFFSSCERYGSDGLPGRAFLSVNWDVSKPLYLDVGTSAIPNVFEWGVYYRAYPGTYTLDYDGQVWKGTYWANYAWQVDYEIYENPGQPGGPNYNGRDGLNSYFDIVCTPYGPDITWYDARVKPADYSRDVNSTPDRITIVNHDGNYSIKITYRKIIAPLNTNSGAALEKQNSSTDK
jgi:hypothetical protein